MARMRMSSRNKARHDPVKCVPVELRGSASEYVNRRAIVVVECPRCLLGNPVVLEKGRPGSCCYCGASLPRAGIGTG